MFAAMQYEVLKREGPGPMVLIGYLGGGFKYFLFSSLFGEDKIPILINIFQMG